MKLTTLINKHYEKLNENDLYILQYILNHPEKCQNISIHHLSRIINVSTSSIIRMTQKLGFSGFSEFKFALKNDRSRQFTGTQMEEDENFLERFKNCIDDTIKHFQNTDIQPILKMIKNARNIYLYGTGWAQKIAGENLARMFFSCNRPMILIKSFTEFNYMLDHFTIDDFIILISLRGKIYEIIECLQILQLKNIPTLSITDFKTNQLASYATYNLYYQSLEIMKRSGNDWTPNVYNMGSLHVLCDLLYLKYVKFTSHSR